MAVEAAPSILCMADAVLGITETPKIFMVKKLKENMHTILETMYLCMYTYIYIYIHMQKKNIYMWWLSALPSHFFPRDERSGTEWNGVGWPLQWAGGSPRNGSCTIWFTNDNRSSNSYCQQYLWFHSNPKWLSVAHQLQLEDMSCPPEAEIIISCTGTCGSPHLSWAAWRMKLTSVDSWFDGEWSQESALWKI